MRNRSVLFKATGRMKKDPKNPKQQNSGCAPKKKHKIDKTRFV